MFRACLYMFRACIVGRYIAKEYVVNIEEELQLFIGVVIDYDHETKDFLIKYPADGVQDWYSTAETKTYLDLFEEWYRHVSRGGQRFTREKACPIIVKAYRQDKFVADAQKSNPIDTIKVPIGAEAASACTVEGVDDASKWEIEKEKMGARIAALKVAGLREELVRRNLNDKGLKAELQGRLCAHVGCKLPDKSAVKKPTPKHAATWVRTELPVSREPFNDGDFNDDSLRKHLPAFAAGHVPKPWECHDFFFTQEMWDMGRHCFNAFPKFVSAQETRPPWTPRNQPWPPKWTQSPLRFSDAEYKHYTMLLHQMGLKRLGRCNLRKMFSCHNLYQEDWLKNKTSRDKMEAFLRQLHFEDSGDPLGKKFPHSVNYRPNGVPKVGLLHEHFRRRCVLFCPEEEMSYDEATAKYGGAMTFLKHLQSSYKPYDGIRIYCLNGSHSGYCQNFRTGLRDGTSIETMAKGVLSSIKGKGYTVWADNAFVSVAMCKWARDNQINFAGTTRTTYGFPSELINDDLDQGKWVWAMTEPGILAAFWSDVGNVKLMSNHHKPKSGYVLRRVSGLADRVQRSAPTVGVEYNDGMGGTDFFDFMRGQYTTLRTSKKWWKTLYHWVLDSAMFNAFCLHKWCHERIQPVKRYKLDFATFIAVVCEHFLMSRTEVPFRKRRSTGSKTVRTKLGTSLGPHGEAKVIQLTKCVGVCPGADLEKRRTLDKRGKVQLRKCKYCWNARAPRVRKDSVYQCSMCKVSLCVTCTCKYHAWLKFCQK